MEVRAITDGFYGGARRRAGKTFHVADGETSKWFEPTNPEDAAKPKAKATKPAAKAADKPATKPATKPAAKAADKPAEKPADDDGAGDLV
jgi:hypothetical protein